MNVFIICVTIISVTAIVTYGVCYLMTHPTVIKAVKEICRESLSTDRTSGQNHTM